MTIEHPTTEESEDWADRLALEIALDMHRLGNQAARRVTAARLRVVKCEGILEGAEKVGDSVIEAFKKTGGRNASQSV
jgi:hypothetical protein